MTVLRFCFYNGRFVDAVCTRACFCNRKALYTFAVPGKGSGTVVATTVIGYL